MGQSVKERTAAAKIVCKSNAAKKMQIIENVDQLHLPKVEFQLPWSRKKETFYVMASRDGMIVAESDDQICKFNKLGEGFSVKRNFKQRQFPQEFVQQALQVCDAIDEFCVL